MSMDLQLKSSFSRLSVTVTVGKAKPATQSSSAIPTDIRAALDEAIDEEERQCNIIVHGLKKPIIERKPFEVIKRLFERSKIEELERLYTEIEAAYYLNAEKTTILAVMKSKYQVDEILKVAKQLKDGSFHNVFITKDHSKKPPKARRPRVRCPICSKHFASKGSLHRHTIKLHKDGQKESTC